MIYSFTGHRPDKLGNDYRLESPAVKKLEQEITINLVAFGDVEEAIIGMALGVDMLVGYICLELDIPFTAAIPCKDQDRKWNPTMRGMYRYLYNRASYVYYVSEEQYNIFSMPNRNHWMVKNSDKLYSVWDGSLGGTANCMNYAQRIGKPTFIHRINHLFK